MSTLKSGKQVPLPVMYRECSGSSVRHAMELDLVITEVWRRLGAVENLDCWDESEMVFSPVCRDSNALPRIQTLMDRWYPVTDNYIWWGHNQGVFDNIGRACKKCQRIIEKRHA